MKRDKPLYYVKTTGTTGEAKLIPMYIEQDNASFFFKKEIIYNLIQGKISFFMLLDYIEFYDSIEVSNAVTRQFKKIFDSYLSYFIFRYISATPFYLYKNVNHSMDQNLIYALLNKNLTIIFTYFLRSCLENLDKILFNFSYYLDIIKNIDYDRFIELKIIYSDILNKEDSKDWLYKVWPYLKIIICGSSGIYNLYKPRIKYYAKDIIIWSPICACTEMIYGLNDNYYDDTYKFNYKQGKYYKDMIIDDKYLRLKVDTINGLNNYLIDDLLKFTDDSNFIYEGRYNFYNELKITERQFALIFNTENYIYDVLLIKQDDDNNKSYILVMETYNDKKLPLYMINNLKKHINITDIKYTHGKFDNLIDYIKDTSSNKILFREQIKLPRILDYKNEKHQKYIKILIN